LRYSTWQKLQVSIKPVTFLVLQRKLVKVAVKTPTLELLPEMDAKSVIVGKEKVDFCPP
jgi:hypothetical protein